MERMTKEQIHWVLNSTKIVTKHDRVPKATREQLEAMSKIYEPKGERESFGVYDEMAVGFISNGNGITSAYEIKKQLKIAATDEDRMVVFDNATDVFQYILTQLAVAEIDDAYRVGSDECFAVCLDNKPVPTPKAARRRPYVGLCPYCKEPELWLVREDHSADLNAYRLFCQRCNKWIDKAPIPIVEI